MRETARALREGRVSPARLLSWLAGEQAPAGSLADRVKALEDRVTALEMERRAA